MTVTVKLNYLRISPRKVRLIADLIRGKEVKAAKNQLQFLNQKAAYVLLKFLNSATAAARNDFHLDESNLYISKLLVDEGPKLKRWRQRARGMAYEIQKKTSHITLVLDEIEKRRKSIKAIRSRPETLSPSKVKKKTIRKQKEPVGKQIQKELPKEKKEGVERAKFIPKFGYRKPKIEKGIKRIFRRKAF
jgi:large subunit ribosomal protein L22